MGTIFLTAGTGVGSTRQSAYDAALTDAGISQYNLSTVSSVIPASARIEELDGGSALGDTGDVLTVVQARQSVEQGTHGVAGLAWARHETGEGIFYEECAVGTDARESVLRALNHGIDDGLKRRGWIASTRDSRLATIDTSEDEHGCAVVVAAYGQAKSVW